MYALLPPPPPTLFLKHRKRKKTSQVRHSLSRRTQLFTIGQSRTSTTQTGEPTGRTHPTCTNRANHPRSPNHHHQFLAWTGLFATGSVDDDDEAVLRVVTSTGAILIGFPSSRSLISAPVRVSYLIRAVARRSRSRRWVCRQAHARWYDLSSSSRTYPIKHSKARHSSSRQGA